MFPPKDKIALLCFAIGGIMAVPAEWTSPLMASIYSTSKDISPVASWATAALVFFGYLAYSLGFKGPSDQGKTLSGSGNTAKCLCSMICEHFSQKPKVEWKDVTYLFRGHSKKTGGDKVKEIEPLTWPIKFAGKKPVADKEMITNKEADVVPQPPIMFEDLAKILDEGKKIAQEELIDPDAAAPAQQRVTVG